MNLLYLSVSRQNVKTSEHVVHLQNECLGERLDSDFSAKSLLMIVSLRHFLGWLVSDFRSRDLALENLAVSGELLFLQP